MRVAHVLQSLRALTCLRVACQRKCRSNNYPIQLAWNNILSELPRFSIPPELGITTLPCWKVDEVRQLSIVCDIFVYSDDYCSINIFLWAVVLLCHAACKSFGALFAVRFLLGMCEGAITPGFMIVTSMFYTHAEQTRRVGYWCTLWFRLLVLLSHLL